MAEFYRPATPLSKNCLENLFIDILKLCTHFCLNVSYAPFYVCIGFSVYACVVCTCIVILVHIWHHRRHRVASCEQSLEEASSEPAGASDAPLNMLFCHFTIDCCGVTALVARNYHYYDEPIQ